MTGMPSKKSDLIDSRIPNESVDIEPPLGALLYAAQGILHPTLSFGHIPDLLDILSQVERVREFSLEHAKWALIWQRFYETRPSSSVRVLRKSEKEAIKKLLKPERLDATRRIFFCIIEQAIRMVRAPNPPPRVRRDYPQADALTNQARALLMDTCRRVVSFAPLSSDLLSLGTWQRQ